MSKLKRFIIFLVMSYCSAFVFEEVPRVIWRYVLGDLTVVHLWDLPEAPVFFSLWYGLLFSVAYFLFQHKRIVFPVCFGICVGMIAETFLFGQMNVVSFFVFPLIYGAMFYVPFFLIGILCPRRERI